MSACRSCKAPVEWAVTSKTGTSIPLDPGVFVDGNIVEIGTAIRGAPLVHVFVVDDLVHARQHGEPALRRSHFVSCPNAAIWRNPTKGET